MHAAFLDRPRLQAAAHLLGESEAVLRHLLRGCLLLAALAALAWAAGCIDGQWLPAGHAGAVRVVHAFLGLAALAFAAVAAGLVALGHCAAAPAAAPVSP